MAEITVISIGLLAVGYIVLAYVASKLDKRDSIFEEQEGL